MKKGAMFGLDARIALAIFGALSVISGAALYSAIQDSKVTALIAEFNELEKAMTAYYLDTGKLPAGTAGGALKTGEIIENTNLETNWNGPYIDFIKNNDYFIEKNGINTSISFGKNVDWGAENTDTIPRTDCTSMGVGETCSLFIARQWINKNISYEIDKKIDGAVDIDTGNVRLWCDHSSHPNKCTIYFKISIPAPL